MAAEEKPELVGHEKPDLETEERGTNEKTPWKASPEIEDMALETVVGFMPTNMRASPHRLEEFYQHGCLLYKFGRYADAQPYFHMLTLANPENAKYLMALGACYHMQKDYVTAIQLYSMTMYFEPDNPMPLYHMADCYIKKLEPFSALIALEMAIEKCNDPKHSALKDRMGLMVNRLGNELKEKMKQGSESFVGKSGRKVTLFNGEIIQEEY